MNGIIVLNKPAGYTSHDCIQVMRRLVGIKKIGHTGTLDPNATGVLPVCIGKATKLIEYMDAPPKSYRATVKLGIETDTQDIWGETIAECSDFEVSYDVLEAVISDFKGEQEQVPPAYSAVRINGRRLYEYARDGQTVEVKARKINVYSIDLLYYLPEEKEFCIEVSCSRGTFIRTICSDIGKALGCGAAMSSLVRTSACGYNIDEAVTFEDIEKNGAEMYLRPFETAVSGLDTLELNEKKAYYFVNGNPVWTKGIEKPAHNEPLAVFCGSKLLGTAVLKDDELTVVKVFRDEDI